MHSYWVKTPRWLKSLFHQELIWDMPKDSRNTVYLTFDDGPHPTATTFVLDQLHLFNAKATFFCVGSNVAKHPEIYSRIIAEGHTAGNHTHDHLNGWKTDRETYLRNVLKAGEMIKPRIFRPPYGRIKLSQVKALYKNYSEWKIYMWDILTGDFDKTITPAQCAENATKQLEPGSIVVFHDSEKAWERMSYALPVFLQFCREKGWRVAALPY